MSRFRLYHLALAVIAAGLMAGPARAVIVDQWDFNAIGLQAQGYNNSNASTGTGTATQLGMTNAYIYTNGEGPGSTAGCDVVNTAGTAVPAFNENTWRIRGNSNSKNAGAGNANGWNTAAPEYSQGAEFDMSSVGYTDLSFVYDWYCTTQGVANMEEQYTTDGINWVNFAYLTATSNDYYNGDGFTGQITMDLSAIPGVNNDANFGIRLVSAFAADGTYDAAAGGVYNNQSGNWRFGDLVLNGTAVPEPSSICLGGLALLGLAFTGYRRKK